MKVVLFDLDDTLFAHTAAVDAGVTAFALAQGWQLRADSLDRWHALEEHHYHRYLGGQLTFLEQRAERARDFALDFGVTLDDPLAWFGEYSERYRLAWSLHDDAIDCLDAMPDSRFGIITNGELPFQLAKISTVGILDRVEHVIASGELGFTKPDPRIFEHAVSLFGVRPADAAYVGDRFETDALGASRAARRKRVRPIRRQAPHGAGARMSRSGADANRGLRMRRRVTREYSQRRSVTTLVRSSTCSGVGENPNRRS